MKSGIIQGRSNFLLHRPGHFDAFGWGEHTFIRTIQTQTMLIRHKATEEQRRVAERNAKAFFSQLTPAKKTGAEKEEHPSRTDSDHPKPRDFTYGQRCPDALQSGGRILIDGYAYEFDAPLQTGTIAQAKGIDPEYVGQ